MFVNRGIYHKGWTAVTRHSTPWDLSAPLPPIDEDVWELYGPDDWTQAHDLAAEQPEQLADLQRLFLIEAAKYNVLPLDDRRVERFNSDLAGRPTADHGQPPGAFGGMGRLTENSCQRQEQVARRHGGVDVPERERRRHRRAGRRVRRLDPLRSTRASLRTATTCSACSASKVMATRPMPAGDHQVRMEFAYDGGGLGKGGTADLYVDGTKVGEGRVEAHRADDVLGRRDHGPRRRHRHAGERRLRPRGSDFTGRVNWVQIDIGEAAEDNDHLITPEERMRIAMARQ